MPVVLQLSDPHLLQEPEACLRGVPTSTTFAEVLDLARARLPTIDRIVLTGDLAHDECPPTYRALHGLLGPDASRSLVLPGNHDDRAGLRAMFAPVGFGSGSGREAECDDSIRFVTMLDGWCLVGLDSQITGRNDGRLGPAQCRWLQQVLSVHAQAPTVVFVHHHPIPTGHPWMDTMNLQDADALADVLAEAPQVQALCHGHIHRDREGQLGAVPVYGAPSTAFQFPAHPDDGAYDLRPPGCRVLYLSDLASGEPPSLRTEVLRLPRLDYPPVKRSD